MKARPYSVLWRTQRVRWDSLPLSRSHSRPSGTTISLKKNLATADEIIVELRLQPPSSRIDAGGRFFGESPFLRPKNLCWRTHPDSMASSPSAARSITKASG